VHESLASSPQVLQQQIRSKSRASSAQVSAQPELSVGECLGRGGFGVVYSGRWHRVPVAVKVRTRARARVCVCF
jgi:predicted Ser/Thr protein kinase